MNTILDLLEAYKWTRDLNVHRNVTFRTFLVIGYAVAANQMLHSNCLLERASKVMMWMLSLIMCFSIL